MLPSLNAHALPAGSSPGSTAQTRPWLCPQSRGHLPPAALPLLPHDPHQVDGSETHNEPGEGLLLSPRVRVIPPNFALEPKPLSVTTQSIRLREVSPPTSHCLTF